MSRNKKLGDDLSEYKSFFKTVNGNEGSKCLYSTRLDTYGCDCQHDCKYCYAKSLLDFRKLWNADDPSIADIKKIQRTIKKIPSNSIIRLGGMTDCFQPLEEKERVTLETSKLLNSRQIGYLIVTKSHLISNPEYMNTMDKNLAHIQITVTSLHDERARKYENASLTSKRIQSILELQDKGYDVAIRLSPLLEEYMDFDALNELHINKCIVEFLRVNTWIKRWLPDIDYSKYVLKQSNYQHLPLDQKKRILSKIKLSNISVCEDVTEHYEYWKENYNPNKLDCCNLDKQSFELNNI